MKIFVELTFFASSAERAGLSQRVRQLEDAGATGVSLWDHIFVSEDGPRAQSPTRPCDPLTTLAIIAGMSGQLELQTVVANTQWMHPALMLRQFAQLAVAIGGQRVTAGLGAGWNREEFDALGMPMAPLPQRLDRLEETLQIARQLYHEGLSNFDGKHLTTRDLPLAPVPSTPPNLLVGGSSDRVMEMAGRYADVVDMVGTVLKSGENSGRTVYEKHVNARARQARTTVDDLAERMGLVRQAAKAAGRAEDAVRASNQVYYVAFAKNKAEVEHAEADLCANWAFIPAEPLADNPFLLIGTPQQMADALLERQERYGLSQIMLQEREEVPSARSDQLRFCHEVVPLLP